MNLSRRQFLAALPFLASAASRAAEMPMTRIRVGAQGNGFPLNPGDWPALLGALRQLKAMDYVGMECNIRFVQGQFGRIDEARREMTDTGVEFISAHTNMGSYAPATIARDVEHLRAL